VPDPKTWATGGDPMTSKQKALLETLASEKGASVDIESLDKGSASMEIEKLKNAAGNEGQESTSTSSNQQSDTPATKLTESGDPATDKQQRYLAVLEDGNKDSEDSQMSKAEASEKIAKLKAEKEQ
jgi:hypothetical protein